MKPGATDMVVNLEIAGLDEAERIIKAERKHKMLRVVVFALVAGLSAGLVIAGLSGCGAAQQQSVTAKVAAGVRSAHEATNAARDAFVEANRTAEAVIVAAATSEAQGIEMLRQLDVRRAPVLRAFALVYAALGRAESLVELVAAGKRDPLSLMHAAMEVARAAEEAYAAVRSFK